MKKIYNYTDYRKFLKDFIEHKKEMDSSFTFSSLSEKVGIQRSYLSQVLSDRGNLNSDQVFLIANELQLDEQETDFLGLLLEIERTQVIKRKSLLNLKRKKIKESKIRSEIALKRSLVVIDSEDLVKYYCDPYCSLVHMFLIIPSYSSTKTSLMRLEKKLKISQSKLSEVINILEKCGLIEIKNGEIKVIKKNQHLSAKNHLSKTNATLLRLKAIEYGQKSTHEADYFFTASFCADEDVTEKVKGHYLDFLAKVSPLINKAPSKEVFQMNFDLFRY